MYQSVEVQQHLPSQSFTFSSVDRDWRELVESATVNPSVMTVCLKEGCMMQTSMCCPYILSVYVFVCMLGVLGQLEKLQASLLQCRAALVAYAEGQRSKCHWFHFIPLDDVLQFVCCGECVITHPHPHFPDV